MQVNAGIRWVAQFADLLFSRLDDAPGLVGQCVDSAAVPDE
jgi:hypothetical protein